MCNCEKIFREKYINLIRSVQMFFEDKDNFSADEFIDDISRFIEYLKVVNYDLLSDVKYVSLNDLKTAAECYSNKILEDAVCSFADLLFHYYSLYAGIENGSDEWAEKANMLQEYLEDYFLKKARNSDPVHYMKLMPEECYSDFEFTLDLIHNQLLKFDTSLYYCKKIIAFLDEFYPEKMFPMDAMFLNHYLSNTVDLMILTVTKIYFDACNIDKRTNCGIKYLQSFIGRNIKDKSVIQDKLRQAKTEINSVMSSAGNLEIIRNKLIAHFDIKDAGTAQQIYI